MLRGTPSDGWLYGGEGNDALIGDDLPKSETGAGDDLLQGNAGNDTIFSGLSRAAVRLTGTVLRPIMPLAAVLAMAAVPAPAAADTTAPTIASVTISSAPSFDADGDNTADTYVQGDRIVVDVRFSEAVTVSGGNNNVRLRLDLGTDDTNLANSRRVLKLRSVVGGDTLRFEHRVARWDSDPDGVWVQTLSTTNAQTVNTVGGAAVTSTATGVAAVRTKSGLPSTGAANHKVDGSRTQAPAATNKAPTFPANAPASLSVAENNAAGAPVGRVSATDSDGDALTYTLDSASDALFDIDSSGNITVTAANALDYETKASYTLTVSVHDGKNAAGSADTTVDATHSLTITVTNVVEPPTIASVTGATGAVPPGMLRKLLIFHACWTPYCPSRRRGPVPLPDCLHLRRSSPGSPRLDKGCILEGCATESGKNAARCIQLDFSMAPIGNIYRLSPPRRGPEPAFSLLHFSLIASRAPHG